MNDYFLWQTILVGILVLVTVYYAIQTHRQANLSGKQLKTIAEQRRKSIQPSLQIGKISYFYRHLEIEGTDKEALIPGIEFQVINVGLGPALDLNISATAAIEFIDETNQIDCNRKLHFKLQKLSRELFLERTIEPVCFRLDLAQIDIAQFEDMDTLIHVNLEFRDVDQSLISEIKSIPLSEDMFRLVFSGNEKTILPCDPNYPTHLLPLH